ncbi:MAG: ketoacyl-ACP synthase III [Gammaproteobacteria bacterium]|jgi:3-oxoacyl-[acyl-carrier-protein] synthase-3|nr:ketoacyl-ACP synthase III [Gammaproteobacteria bacterium]
MLKYSRIAGTGSYLPEKVLTNHDLESMFETSDEWIRERTGIRKRHLAAPDQTTVDLAYIASLRALEAAGVTAEEVDLIVFGTTTPDLVFPNCGALLQDKLGIRTACPAIGLEAACSGFMYSLSIADKFIKLGEAQCALVVGAETLSRIVDWTDRSTAIIFGDGAGAAVLKPADAPGIISTHLHTDGTYKDLLYCSGGPSRGFKQGTDGRIDAFIRMTGNEIFKVAVKSLGAIVDETLAANNLDKSAIDWLVPHQANIRIIQATAKKLDMPMERVIVTVDEHANTSAASVPLALDTGIRDGRIKRGDLILLEAFGGGLTWGSALIRY